MLISELVAQTKHLLYGAGAYEDNVTELTSNLTNADLIIPVEDAAKFGSGVIEIDYELIRIKSVSKNNLTAFTFGRGYKSTTASYHVGGAEVTYQPMIANGTIFQIVKRVVNSLYPSLYGVKDFNWEVKPFVELPDDAIGVIAVFNDNGNQEDYWAYQPDNNNRLLVRTSGDYRIVYATQPGVIVSPADDWRITGLPERIADIVAVGAAAELAPFLDMGRAAHTGMDARLDESRPAGLGVQLGSKFRADYQRRLENEMMALQKEHPIRVHKERLNYGS